MKTGLEEQEEPKHLIYRDYKTAELLTAKT